MFFIILAVIYGIGLGVTFLGYLFSWDHDTHPAAAVLLAILWPAIALVGLLALGVYWISGRKE